VNRRHRRYARFGFPINFCILWMRCSGRLSVPWACSKVCPAPNHQQVVGQPKHLVVGAPRRGSVAFALGDRTVWSSYMTAPAGWRLGHIAVFDAED